MKHYINIRIMMIAAAAILMAAVFCTYACYRVFREEVIDNLRICTRILSEKENIGEEDILLKYASDLYDDHIRNVLVTAKQSR